MDWGALGHPAVGVQAVGPELPGTVSLNNITHCLRVDFPSTRCCGLTLVRRSGAAGNEWTCHFCDRPELESFGFATRLCLLKHPGSKSHTHTAVLDGVLTASTRLAEVMN